MGRKRHRQQQKAGGEGVDGQPPPHKEKGEQHHGEGVPDPPAAAIAIHPTGAVVAVAAGPEIRVYDSRLQEVKTLRVRQKGLEANKQFIRGLAFDGAGNYLLAGCDDKGKGMLLWDCGSWEQVQALKVPKRVSAVALTNDGAYMLAADKFGDVCVAATRPGAAAPELLLGHFCSILTSVCVSRCGGFVATTDRDGKARVSVLPPNPLAGAHEIQSYCLGHNGFVTCSAFVAQPGGGKELLVTGGADSTARLWDHLTGELLSTWQLPQPQQQQPPQQQQQQEEPPAAAAAEGGSEAAEAAAQQEQQDMEQEGADGGEGEGEQEQGGGEGPAAEGNGGGDEEEERVPAVLSVAPSADGRWVAAAVEDRDDVLLLQVDWEGRALREAGWRALQGLHMPTQLAFGPGRRLWAVGGPPNGESVAAFLACSDVCEDGAASGAFPADALPADARAALAAADGSEAAAVAAADEARRQRAARLSALVRKRRYLQQEIENRKRQRRDVRAKAAIAAAAAQAQQLQQQQG